MNKDVLTTLGCSGSLAFMILTSPAANAQKVSPLYTGVVGTTPIGQERVNVPSQEYPQTSSLNPNSDRIGDIAMLKFGCDCMSCRNAIVSMIQSGSLALPQ